MAPFVQNEVAIYCGDYSANRFKPDFAAFEQVLEEAVERTQMRLLADCVLPDHWHLVIWPREDGELFRFTPLADADAHATLARSPSPHRQWPRVPRTVQVLSGAWVPQRCILAYNAGCRESAKSSPAAPHHHTR
jgi:hypothetical protein